MIVSFDVGTANMAYCAARASSGRPFGVVGMGVRRVASRGASVEDLLEGVLRMCRDVEAELEMSEGDVVLVEKQPSRSAALVRAEAFVASMFATRGYDVRVRHPTHKCLGVSSGGRRLKRDARSRRDRYADRKYESVRRAMALVADDPEASESISSATKRDDLADAILQAAHFMGTDVPEAAPEPALSLEELRSARASKPPEGAYSAGAAARAAPASHVKWALRELAARGVPLEGWASKRVPPGEIRGFADALYTGSGRKRP